MIAPSRGSLCLAVLVLASAPALAQDFAAVLRDGSRDHTVGVVRLDPRYHLSVVSAQPDKAGWLDGLLKEMNQRDTMHIEAAAPPGAPPFANVSEPVLRSDPRFLQAQLQFLQDYHSLVLRRQP